MGGLYVNVTMVAKVFKATAIWDILQGVSSLGDYFTRKNLVRYDK